MFQSALIVLILCINCLIATESTGLKRLMEGNQRYRKDALEHPNRTSERREAVAQRHRLAQVRHRLPLHDVLLQRQIAPLSAAVRGEAGEDFETGAAAHRPGVDPLPGIEIRYQKLRNGVGGYERGYI